MTVSAQGGMGYFLVGPTAVGKSAVGQWLAVRRGADVLSADSMQVYKGMDVGTAKMPLAERGGVRYWGVDVAEPGERYDVWQYLVHARTALSAVRAAGRHMIVVGGTGLYVRALTRGLAPAPGADEGFRAMAQRVFEEEGTAGLRARIGAMDAGALAALGDEVNPRRLIRAWEILEQGGCVPRRGSGPGREGAACRGVVAGLQMERSLLARRIEERVRAMYEGGLLEEAARLIDAGGLSQTASKAIGYAEALAVLGAGMGIEEAIERTTKRTRQYAKRQMTWFRRQERVGWVVVEEGMSTGDVAERVATVWDERLGGGQIGA